ncbi:hypothetical protein ABZP36_005809 [Zizania latifolia]
MPAVTGTRFPSPSRILADPDLPPLSDTSFAYVFPLALKSSSALGLPSTAASLHTLAPLRIRPRRLSHALARRLFDELPRCNAVVWSAMISVHIRSGDVAAALRELNLMDVAPTASCFNSVIAAVAKSGDTEGCGQSVSDSDPASSHCWTYGVVGLAEVAGRALFEIEPENAGNFVSLANIFGHQGMSLHEEAEQVRREMEQASSSEISIKHYQQAPADACGPQH